MSWKMSWEGFKYEPVRGLFERVQRRVMRTHRRSMLRVFVERGLDLFAYQMKQLRKAKTVGEQKMVQFRRILDDYAKLVTETTSSPAQGPVDMSGA